MNLLQKLQAIIFLSDSENFRNATFLVMGSETNDQNHWGEENASLKMKNRWMLKQKISGMFRKLHSFESA